MVTYRFEYTTEEGLQKVEYKKFKNKAVAYVYLARLAKRVPIKGGFKVGTR